MIVRKKKQYFLLIFYIKYCILGIAVTLIAVKREVATYYVGFPWSECQGQCQVALTRESGDKSLYQISSAVRRNDT